MVLIEHLPLLSTAPVGIHTLRGLILQLAVRGKLTPQDPNDEPASELLKRTAQQRAALVATGKKTKLPLPMSKREQPFEVPDNWAHVCLGDVLEMINGRAFKSSDWRETGIPIVRIQNLNNKNAPYNFCDADTLDQRHRISSGDFLISWSGTPGTSFGAFIWDRGEAALNQHIFRCVQVGAAFDKEFLRLAINSQLNVLIAKAQGGVGLQHVTKGTLDALVLPLPPEPEQRRILNKVDELMALCDQLEAEQADAESAQAKLVEILLGTLTESTDATDFAANWKRLAEHFDTLFTTESSFDTLKQTIWQLAVTGKLVPQDPADETGSELLKRIRFERASSSVLSRSKVNKSSVINVPKKLPCNWEWTQLGDLAETGPSNGYSPKPCSHETRFRSLTLSATTKGYFKSDCFKYVDITEDIAERFFLKQGDLLIQRGNSIEYVGMAALYDHADDEFIYPDLMMRIRLTKHCNARFIHTWLISKDARNYFMKSATGTQGTMPKVNQGVVSNTPVPFPPLAEQHRIVAKVDELITLCDRLKAGLAESRTQQDRLALALIESALKAA